LIKKNGMTLSHLIFSCGALHLAVSVASLSIPTLLRWRPQLQVLNPLLRQMFWTYAAYILFINTWFGIMSLIATDELMSKSTLAKSITLFIAAYWFARLAIQFFYFDRSEAPGGLLYIVGEAVLVGLFLLFAVVYSVAFFYNIS